MTIYPLGRIFSLMLCASMVLAWTSDAYAGLSGCSRQRQPGDYLQCGGAGPFGPAGPNTVECRAECTAYANCLNNPPAGGCQTQRNALEQCCPGCHDTAYPPPGGAPAPRQNGAVTYAPGVGCFVVGGQKEHILGRSSVGGLGATNRALTDQSCPIDIIVSLAVVNNAEEIARDYSALQLSLASSSLKQSDDYYKDLGASWEDVRAIGSAIGAALEVDVHDEVIDNINTIEDLTNCIQSAVSSAS